MAFKYLTEIKEIIKKIKEQTLTATDFKNLVNYTKELENKEFAVLVFDAFNIFPQLKEELEIEFLTDMLIEFEKKFDQKIPKIFHTFDYAKKTFDYLQDKGLIEDTKYKLFFEELFMNLELADRKKLMEEVIKPKNKTFATMLESTLMI
jgi:hypothetical protein